MKKTNIIFGVLALVLTNNAHSTILDLEERDYLAAGDGLITYDKTTGLEWLDLTFTAGLSMLEVEANAAIWANGWQWATIDQMEIMFDHARDDDLWSDPYNEPRVVYPIVELLGPTYTSGVSGEYITKSVYGVSRNFESLDSGYTYSFMKGGIGLDSSDSFYPNLPFPLCDPEACVDWYDGEPYFLETDSDPNYGSWLVRTSVVPVPAAVWLFGSGLLGLIGLARRKERV